MRRSLFAGSVLAFVSTPVLAQSLPGPKDIGAAVTNTICVTALRTEAQCAGTAWQNTMDKLQAEVNSILGSDPPTLPNNWMALLKGVGQLSPQYSPLNLLLGWLGRNNTDNKFPGAGGSSGGGGATGSWNEEGSNPCDKYRFRIDQAGNFVLPTIPLSPGKELNPYAEQASIGPPGTPLWRISTNGDNYADSPQAVALWYIHQLNKAVPVERWSGVYATAPYDSNGPTLSFQVSSKSYWDGTAWALNANGPPPPANYGLSTGVFPNWRQHPQAYNGYADPCPKQGNGGTFNYYIHPIATCVMYSPNYSISPSGYYYPTEVAIPIATALGLTTQSASTLACELNPEALRLLANELWKRAAAKPGYNGIPHSEVKPEDVRNNGEQPRIEEMKAVPTLPAAPSSPAPSSTPTPSGGSPTPTATTEAAPPPQSSLPDLVAPEIDWWPELPSIELSLGSPACPTYPIDVPPPFDWHVVLDSHCGLIEQNRALIAAIMLLVWTASAAVIVLRS